MNLVDTHNKPLLCPIDGVKAERVPNAICRQFGAYPCNEHYKLVNSWDAKNFLDLLKLEQNK